MTREQDTLNDFGNKTAREFLSFPAEVRGKYIRFFDIKPLWSLRFTKEEYYSFSEEEKRICTILGHEFSELKSHILGMRCLLSENDSEAVEIMLESAYEVGRGYNHNRDLAQTCGLNLERFPPILTDPEEFESYHRLLDRIVKEENRYARQVRSQLEAEGCTIYELFIQGKLRRERR